MKAKLLKQIRKRYSWYFNKDNFPVLLDNKKEEVILFDIEYCSSLFNYTAEDVKLKVKASLDEWCMRIFKNHLLSKYGWNIKKTRYRQARAYLKSKK